MFYKILADATIVLHLLFILFMIGGFFLTLFAILFKKEKFFARWLFRTLHLLGILFVSTLSVLGKYCPLTLLENAFRLRANTGLVYSGSFLIHYLERFIYPEVDPLVVQIPTLVIALFTIAVFVAKFPRKKYKGTLV